MNYFKFYLALFIGYISLCYNYIFNRSFRKILVKYVDSDLLEHFLSPSIMKPFFKLLKKYVVIFMDFPVVKLIQERPIFLVIFAVILLGIILIKLAPSKEKTFLDQYFELMNSVALVYSETTDRYVLEGWWFFKRPKVDQTGKPIKKTRDYYPQFEVQGKKVIIFNIRKEAMQQFRKNEKNYNATLIQGLYDLRIGKSQYGVVKPNKNGQLEVEFLTLKDQRERRFHKICDDFKLFYDEVLGEIYNRKYPTIELKSNGDLHLDCRNLGIKIDDLQKAMEQFSIEYSTKEKRFEYTFASQSQDNPDTYILHTKKDVKKCVETTVAEEFDNWINGPVKELQKLYKETNQFHWYFGGVRDGSIDIGSASGEIFVSSDLSPHLMIVGTTGSGKSEYLKSMLLFHAQVYGSEVEIICGNGSDSEEFDPIHQKFSKFGHTSFRKVIGSDTSHPLVEVQNVLKYVQKRQRERIALFREVSIETGTTCANIQDYKRITGKKLPHIIVAIDEFAGLSEFLQFDSNSKSPGSPAQLLHEFLSQYRKVGISAILASQEARAATFPSRLATNLSTRIIMRITGRDIKYMKEVLQVDFSGFEPGKLKTGEALIECPHLTCKVTRSPLIPAYQPYLGENMNLTLDRIESKVDMAKTPDYDRAMVVIEKGFDGIDFQKMDIKKFFNMVLSAFIKHEDYKVLKTYNPQYYSFSLFFKNEKTGKKYALAILNGDEVDIRFNDRVIKEGYIEIDKDSEGKLVSDHKIIYMFKTLKNSQVKSALDLIDTTANSCEVLTPLDYNKPLLKAIKNQGDQIKEPIFWGLIEPQQKSSDIIAIQQSDEKVDDQINLKEYEKLKTTKTKDKGPLFEKWYASFLRKQGKDVESTDELKSRGILSSKVHKGGRDSGLDLLYWTDRKNKKAVGIQCKNRPTSASNKDDLKKVLKTIDLYRDMCGIEFERFIFVTTGKFQKDAIEYANSKGIIILSDSNIKEDIYNFNRTFVDDIYEIPEKIRPMKRGKYFPAWVKRLEDLRGFNTEFAKNERSKGNLKDLSGKKSFQKDVDLIRWVSAETKMCDGIICLDLDGASKLDTKFVDHLVYLRRQHLDDGFEFRKIVVYLMGGMTVQLRHEADKIDYIEIIEHEDINDFITEAEHKNSSPVGFDSLFEEENDSEEISSDDLATMMGYKKKKNSDDDFDVDHEEYLNNKEENIPLDFNQFTEDEEDEFGDIDDDNEEDWD